MANRSAGLVRFLDVQQAQTSAFQPAGTVTLMDVIASINANRLSGTTLAPNVVNSSLATLGIVTSGTWNASVLTASYGGTGMSSFVQGDLLYADSSSTLSTIRGNASATYKYLRQAGNGITPAAPVWDDVTAVVQGSALSITNDTNVTLTLSGAPNTALVNSATIAAGWTGTLAVVRGGTGLSAVTLGDVLYSNGANSLAVASGNTSTTKKYLSQTGTGTVSAAPTWSTIAASDLTGTSLPATIVSSSLTSLGTISSLIANRQVNIESSLTGYPKCQASFCIDDGQFGAYTGTKFGNTNNNHGYANKMDVLSYTRTGISGGSSAGIGYSILGLRALIDRYQNDGVTCPRESTYTASRSFYNGGIGATAQGEGMDMFNNKYPEFPNGTGINYGITLYKTGNDALYREFVINFRCPTRQPATNTTNVFRILPYCSNYGSGASGLTADKVTSARIRLEASPVDVVCNPVNFISSTVTSLPVLSISTVTHKLGVASSSDLFTGMSIVFAGTGTEPKANIANCISLSDGKGLEDQGHILGAGQISVTVGSTQVTGVDTSFTAETCLTVGAIIAFGQYAYTVASILNNTTLYITENAFASVTSAKWYFSYPPDSAVYPGKLAVGGEYFVIVIDETSIQLATTYHNALKGINIQFLRPASGVFYINYNRQTSVCASANLPSNTTFVLPSNAPIEGARLVTDGSGNTTWTGGSPLSVVSDANVTLTLSGAASSALLDTASIAAGWTGTLAVARGGTGLSTTAVGDILYANNNNSLTTLAGNTSATRKFLQQAGNGVASNAPVWDTILAADVPGSALTVGNDTNITLALGGTPSTALLRSASITAGWTGTLATNRGGTGQSTYTDGQLLIGNSSTGQLTKATLTQVSSNQVLITNSNGAISLSLPQGIHPTNNSPQFAGLGLGSVAVAGITLYVSRAQTTATNANLYGALSLGGLSVTGGTTAIAASAGCQDSVSVSGTGTITTAANVYASGNFTTSGTSTMAAAAGVYVRPSFSNGVGCTLTAAYGLYVKPASLNATATVPTYAGVYCDTVAATGTVTNGYGGYFKAPTNCTNAIALYTDSLNVNVAPSSAPTAGRINCNSLRASGGALGGVVVNNATLATNATDGFLYISTCAGAPTGTPTAQTGTVAMVYDTTNNNLYIYSGSGWKKTTTFA
jgi:hypothetical protein